jgi:hypothetical protein
MSTRHLKQYFRNVQASECFLNAPATSCPLPDTGWPCCCWSRRLGSPAELDPATPTTPCCCCGPCCCWTCCGCWPCCLCRGEERGGCDGEAILVWGERISISICMKWEKTKTRSMVRIFVFQTGLNKTRRAETSIDWFRYNEYCGHMSWTKTIWFTLRLCLICRDNATN